MVTEREQIAIRVAPFVEDGALFEAPLRGLGIHNPYLRVWTRVAAYSDLASARIRRRHAEIRVLGIERRCDPRIPMTPPLRFTVLDRMRLVMRLILKPGTAFTGRQTFGRHA